MTKASDNEFPKLILAMQTTDPAAPSDSDWKTYAKPDGIYARSSNAIVGPFGTGAASVPVKAGAMAYRSAATQTVNNTAAALNLDTEGWDTDAFHDNVTNNTRMTIPAGFAGVYLCTGQTFVSAAGLSWIGIRVNGVATRGGGNNRPDAASGYAACSAVLDLAEADYVELWVQTSANVNLGHASAVDAMSTLTIQRIAD